MKKVTVKRILF